MTNNIIKVSDYTRVPGPRYKGQGEGSGEEYYSRVLKPAFENSLKSAKSLQVVLDGTIGYASSFLDEAFGRLVYEFTESKVREYLSIVSLDEPEWIEMLLQKTYPQWEKRRLSGIKPKEAK